MKISKKDFDDVLESVGYTSTYLPDDTINITKDGNTLNFHSQEDAIRYLDSKGLFETAYLKPDNSDMVIPDYQTALRMSIENGKMEMAKAISTYMFLV